MNIKGKIQLMVVRYYLSRLGCGESSITRSNGLVDKRSTDVLQESSEWHCALCTPPTIHTTHSLHHLRSTPPTVHTTYSPHHLQSTLGKKMGFSPTVTWVLSGSIRDSPQSYGDFTAHVSISCNDLVILLFPSKKNKHYNSHFTSTGKNFSSP